LKNSSGYRLIEQLTFSIDQTGAGLIKYKQHTRRTACPHGECSSRARFSCLKLQQFLPTKEAKTTKNEFFCALCLPAVGIAKVGVGYCFRTFALRQTPALHFSNKGVNLLH
jgi:hypothetical protein